MANLICTAFYSKDLSVKSPGMGDKIGGINIYLKNIFVSLVSALKHNPKCEVALITNLKSDYSYLLSQLESEGVKIYQCEFDNFIMPEDFKWQYAFYKLKALEFIQGLDFDRVLLLDNDTFCVENLNDLWKDSVDRILLYDTKHSYSHPVRGSIISDWMRVYGTRCSPIQWGGEFICADKDRLIEFVNELAGLYALMKEKGYPVDHDCGDELFISFAAEKISSSVRPANAYINRYWNRGYYLVSTDWCNDPVSIWHLPADKAYGMIDIYNYYMKNRRFPDKRVAAKILNLPYEKSRLSFSMIRYCVRKFKETLLK